LRDSGSVQASGGGCDTTSTALFGENGGVTLNFLFKNAKNLRQNLGPDEAKEFPEEQRSALKRWISARASGSTVWNARYVAQEKTVVTAAIVFANPVKVSWFSRLSINQNGNTSVASIDFDSGRLTETIVMEVEPGPFQIHGTIGATDKVVSRTTVSGMGDGGISATMTVSFE
jgi:hypothetical protein